MAGESMKALTGLVKLQVYDLRDHPEPEKRQVNLRLVSDSGHCLALGIITDIDPRAAAEQIAAGPLELVWTGPDEQTLAAVAQQVDRAAYERAGFLLCGQTGSGDQLARHKHSTLLFRVDLCELRWSSWNDHAKDWDAWQPLDKLAEFLPSRSSNQMQESRQAMLF